MSRIYSIELLESIWPAEDFDAARKLLASSPSPQLKEVSKGLYTLQIMDAGGLEAEIKLVKNEVRKTTCDCAEFQAEKSCAHILAGLILIRKRIDDAPRKKASHRPAKSMNIKSALQHVELNELKLFCRDYARHDNAFSLLLKTRFIRNLPTDLYPDKYEVLLGQIVKIDRSGTVKLNRSERKTLGFMIESMLHHFDEAMVDKRYIEAFEIISAILARLHMTVDRNADYAAYFDEELRQVYEKLRVYLAAPIAPEMKQSAFRYCLELADRSRYRIMDIYFNAISVITPTAINLNVTAELFAMIREKVLSKSGPESKWLPVAALMYFEAEAEKEARELFHRIEQTSFATLAEILYQLKEMQCLLWLVKQVDISIFREKNKIRVYRKVFQAADVLDQPRILEETGIELMILTRDISFFEQLMQNPEIASGRIERIAQEKIRSALRGDPMESLLAQFFIACGKHEELLGLMVQKADIDFFIEHDIHVLPGLKHELTEAYINLIEDHLNHYAGNVNVELIEKWRQHFEALNLNSEIEEGLSKLHAAHPERQLLFGNLKKR